jgi:hypothetical protein
MVTRAYTTGFQYAFTIYCINNHAVTVPYYYLTKYVLGFKNITKDMLYLKKEKLGYYCSYKSYIPKDGLGALECWCGRLALFE